VDAEASRLPECAVHTFGIVLVVSGSVLVPIFGLVLGFKSRRGDRWRYLSKLIIVCGLYLGLLGSVIGVGWINTAGRVLATIAIVVILVKDRRGRGEAHNAEPTEG
jgi:hypothetical protein